MNMRSLIFNHSQCKLAFFFSSLLVVTMWATTALAQYTTARLSGTVQDNTGAAVPGATVMVEQAGTSYIQTIKSGADGEYLFPSLPVGSYQLTVEMAGFSTYVQKGIVLEVGQTASQRVTLAVGAVTQQVTVDGNVSQVTTDDAAITHVIGEKNMENMPMLSPAPSMSHRRTVLLIAKAAFCPASSMRRSTAADRTASITCWMA
jgi:hypothetical protein